LKTTTVAKHHSVWPPGAVLDNPEHHVFSGLKLLDGGQYQQVIRKLREGLRIF